tara:strand:+ start:40 stop:633 length:594 start_codon:yes stop_codon:yes gene_type:complete
MFTSRAEFRLSLRADNADQRLTSLGIDLGCVSEERKVYHEEKMEKLAVCRTLLEAKTFTPKEAGAAGIAINTDGQRRTGFQLLSFPDVSFSDIRALDPSLETVDADIAEQVSKDALYASYIKRQENDVALLRKDEGELIPTWFEYGAIDGLSNELKSKLIKAKPEMLAQASRIDGMTPAALTLLLALIRKGQSKKSA